MPKNIVICADGTGNSTIKGRGTNVFKLYEAVDENGHRINHDLEAQVAIYHDGVGTESLKWIRIVTGATGWGLSRNVKQLYGELARVYDPGDRILLFGFSRGAFTVRTLGGLIATCGILDLKRYDTNTAFAREIDEAYRAYRQKYQTWLSRVVRGKREIDPVTLRARFSVSHPTHAPGGAIPIHFVGVWDTVDAVGMPFRITDVINALFYRFKFPDTTLNGQVKKACHALALDEARRSFFPLLWDQARESDRTRIEQVWFAGVHSNVGGGYPRQGMSLVTLDWMMLRAEAAGLRFNAAERELYRGHVAVNDKRYDSRAGAGMFYRWLPRDAATMCRDNAVPPRVHRTVFDRIARNTEGYAPGTIPAEFEIVSSTLPSAQAREVETTVKRAHADAPSLLASERRLLALGQLSYWLLIIAVVGLLVPGLCIYVLDAFHADGPVRATVEIVKGLFSMKWIGVVLQTIWRMPFVSGILVVILVGSFWGQFHVANRLDRHYSAFWHALRRPLRKALGF
ncbi:MAG: DUF2235 domain-containing protein [Candidatus Rokuibacteriota bacterium]